VKIFISWSGERAQHIASSLRNWIRKMFSDSEPWFSSQDIRAGRQWMNEIMPRLEEADFGIFCLTPENLTAPWLLFEAGAIAKIVQHSFVVPYLFELTIRDLTGPLAQYNAVNADKSGTFKLVQSIDGAREKSWTDQELKEAFDQWWPKLDEMLKDIPDRPSEEKPAQKRDSGQVLEEILATVRRIEGAGYMRGTARGGSMVGGSLHGLREPEEKSVSGLLAGALEHPPTEDVPLSELFGSADDVGLNADENENSN
jgi:hypothetical protein